MTNNLNSNRKRILRFVALTWLLLVPMIIQAQRGNVTLNLQTKKYVDLFGKWKNKRITRSCIVTVCLTQRRKSHWSVKTGH